MKFQQLRISGWQLLPGLLAAGLTLIVAQIGILQPLEHYIYRALFKIRGEQPWTNEVALIEIDQASLDAIGPFPWPRHYYTHLVQQLTLSHHNIVAFDILFAESSIDDASLAEAMAQHGNVVLATAWDTRGGIIGPNARVMQGARSTGHIHHQADSDGITRSYQSRVNGTLALSIAVVQRYRQFFPHFLFSRPINGPGSLWLNWRGSSHTAPRYSFIDVLSGSVPTETFDNKIIFVGYTGRELDSMTTPYDHQSLPTTGVYQHIVAANNLLAQDHLKRLTLPVWLLMLLISSIFGYRLFHQPFAKQMTANLVLVIGWGTTVVVAFNHNYWLPMMPPTIAITTTTHLVKITERLLRP